MWRRLLARAHPDAGGDHDLFIWARELQERVSEGLTIGPAAAPARSPEPAAPPRRRDGTSRIPFETGVPLTFEDLTARALELAPTFREPYPAIFRMLVGCPPLRGWPEELHAEACAGAGFKKLALAGRTLGLDGPGRGGFYKAASKVPLSDLHARYLLDRLQAGDRPPGWTPPGDAGA